MENKKLIISDKTCTLKEVLDIIGGKWAMPIIYILSKGKMRFKELERSIAVSYTHLTLPTNREV